MTITYSMRNVTSDLVKSIMLRKFFQMVFIGNDKKSLHIYTATIIGASSEEPFDKKPFVSNFSELSQFRMRFEFAVGGNDNNEVTSIKHMDLTTTKHGFLEELDCIEKVWGSATDSKCRIILDNQNEIIEKLKKINTVDAVEKETCDQKIARLVKYKILWVEQKKPGLENNVLLQSLAFPGCCQTDVECLKEPNVRDDGSVRSAYAIEVPHDISLPCGMELVNWVRTTIRFKYMIDDNNLNYIIKKDIKDIIDENYTRYFAPDFTWYFSPAVKSFIDNRNSMVEVKRMAQVEQYDQEACACKCTFASKCSYQSRRFTLISDKHQNSIDTVPNKLTVNFYHWTEEEQIGSRQKYRLSTKEILPSYNEFNKLAEINIFLDMADEHNRGNRQFILGLFISFALAFGIDSSRLASVENYFLPLTNIATVDVWWIAFLIFFSLTLMNTPSKLGEKSRNLMKIRKTLLLFSLIWVAVVFVFLRSPLVNIPEDWLYADVLHYGLGSILIILIIGHFIYLNASKASPNDSIWIDLFGEDIL